MCLLCSCRLFWKLCRAKLKPAVKSSGSLEWVSTQPSWWLTKWRCSPSQQSQAAQATTGHLMGEAAQWGGTTGGCVQSRHGLTAKTGLVCSFRTWLTGLGPAQVIHSNKAWPNVPVWKLQGQSWFVRAACCGQSTCLCCSIPAGRQSAQGQTEPLWSDHPLRSGSRHPQRAEHNSTGVCRHISVGHSCVLILCFLLEVSNICDGKAVGCWTCWNWSF